MLVPAALPPPPTAHAAAPAVDFCPFNFTGRQWVEGREDLYHDPPALLGVEIFS